MKFALANPAYGPIEPWCVRSLRQALLVAERRGYHCTAELGAPGSHLIMGRNLVADQVAKDQTRDYEGVLWIDSDIIMHPQHIATFLAGVKDLGMEFGSGVYYKRAGNHAPVHGEFCEPEPDDPGYMIVRWVLDLTAKGWIKIPVAGACGFGMVYTSNEVLLGAGKNPFTKLPFISEPGDDYSFCWRVFKNLGTPLWINLDIQLGHQGTPNVVTRDTFVKWANEDRAKKEKANGSQRPEDQVHCVPRGADQVHQRNPAHSSGG